MSELNPLGRQVGAMDDALESSAQNAGIDVQVIDQFADKNWRMANLYYIEDETGKVVKFVPNEAQQHFFDHMWYLNVNLKARQLGFTTAWCLWMLDECLFYPNQTAGVIAHTLDDAKKIFRKKILFPYEKLPEGLQSAIAADRDTAMELGFSNKSSISVGTSHRSGTLQYLLVSEYGKICARYPDKAIEIVTGSFNTVHEGAYITVESTAEGRAGGFWELCKAAHDLKLAGTPLTRLDWKFHFYGWYWKPEYALSDEDTKLVVIPKKMEDYFAALEKNGIYLTANQKAWYVKKRATPGMGELMKREHPTTWEEAFEQSMKGAYFAEEFVRARAEGRITKVPFEPAMPVHTAWDLGMRDVTAIWFYQRIGRERRFIDYYQNSDVGLSHYAKVLAAKKEEKGYWYGHHHGPHDIMVRELGTGASRLETAKGMGLHFIPGPHLDFEDQLEAGRQLMGTSWFDEINCEEGIVGLESCRKEWDEKRQDYKPQMFHDQHSHPFSAFLTAAVMETKLAQGTAKARPVERAPRIP